jgi:[ribosomal protein S5]-alanine N-acetyltransferase
VITIKPLTVDLCSARYHFWLNDKNVNQYLESRFVEHTYESVRDFVKNIQGSKKEILFGIFNSDDNHIGNIKLGNIDYFHGYAEIGLLIGEKKLAEKGSGTKAIELVTVHAFQELKLRKVMAGVYANNIASIKAFEKNGFKRVGVYKSHRVCDEGIVDQFMYEMLNNQDELISQFDTNS